MAKRYKCPYCELRDERKKLITHIDKRHEEMLPEGYDGARTVYDMINHTNGHGTCRICKKDTQWNTSSQRYDVLCGNPKCKEAMREEYKKNMIRVKGTYNILNDPEQQQKMLANRKISGKYKYSDGTVFTYTGSYEKKLLEFEDNVMNIPSKDIMMPGPTIEYMYKGEKHFYIADQLYIPYNLIIEIKDGGDNKNGKETPGMIASREKTIEKEKVITDKGEYNYLRLTNNDFVQLIEIFMELKENYINGNDSKVIRIHEGTKSVIDSNYKPKGKKDLSSFKKVHITESVINKYKKEYPFLSHVRCKDIKEYICDGYIWFDDNELVAMVGSCQYTDDKTKWVVSLEITNKYKGYGLSKQILDYATKTMNCKYLSVNKNNAVAKKIYDEYGFKVYQEDKTMYYMTIDKDAITEDAHFIESSIDPKVVEIANYINENFIFNEDYFNVKMEPINNNTYLIAEYIIGENNLDMKKLSDSFSILKEKCNTDQYGLCMIKESNNNKYNLYLTNINVFKESISKGPKKCPKCGGKVGVFIEGEPIYKCIDCGEFLGVVPCHLGKKKK